MASKWRKAKTALGLKLCVYAPRTPGEDSPPSDRLSEVSSAVGSPSEVSSASAAKSVSKSSKKTCAICLGTMKPGQGHALFTAECSHTFHFQCITSNVKHGNHVCPVCRAKWKEIPFQVPSSSSDDGRARMNPMNWPEDDALMAILRRLPRADSSNRHHNRTPPFRSSEPSIFDDDEHLDLPSETASDSLQGCNGTVEIKTHPEFSAIPQAASEDNFTILVHLKAPLNSTTQTSTASPTSRAPIDLVTVLDVSGSMSGTKLALLKRAMGFVIQNLGPSDRLSVVAFSSTARRLFHLRRMSELGRQQALQAVNSLSANGGTNIGEGLRKASKVIEQRKEKNPVCSIILLSDGQDTYTSGLGGSHHSQADYRSSLSSSLRDSTAHSIPVHAFGFGDDHDSVAMHLISEMSGGTFSYIEAESTIQDAFAQCIGGLLSVVVQEMDVEIKLGHPDVELHTIKSGGYVSEVVEDKKSGSIHVGDLYAEEERDFLVSVSIPPSSEDMTLLRVSCVYQDPISKDVIRLDSEDVKIQRPVFVEGRTVSIEVERQQNRLHAAEAMAEAKAAAERGAFGEAATILEDRRRLLLQSRAAQSGDRLCVSLDAELKEVQERMASRRQYELSGRAYVLSGLSSHSWQRATARGDSTHSASLVQSYQTPSMVDMLQRSQTMVPPQRSTTSRQIQTARSFNSRPQRR
ncbi:putative RING zinc finger and VWF domain family protein [Iris pallida]|uniref:RING zinc finger and VWF domain family protein n=1 Tax=Iris pallida TaxID=29817 RepID=A0AAX6ESB8_IRIPA|nr:putative RING zinc finger and VWF domain family protein [Iris pallida]KAJ6806729.1 putative RING zinc finger and VWF domain family protein [Iris pallida]